MLLAISNVLRLWIFGQLDDQLHKRSFPSSVVNLNAWMNSGVKIFTSQKLFESLRSLAIGR